MARAEKSPVRAWVALVTLAVLGMGLGAHASRRVLGTAQVDALGNWSFRERDSTQPPNGTRTVSLQSSAGGQALALPVRVRR